MSCCYQVKRHKTAEYHSCDKTAKYDYQGQMYCKRHFEMVQKRSQRPSSIISLNTDNIPKPPSTPHVTDVTDQPDTDTEAEASEQTEEPEPTPERRNTGSQSYQLKQVADLPITPPASPKKGKKRVTTRAKSKPQPTVEGEVSETELDAPKVVQRQTVPFNEEFVCRGALKVIEGAEKFINPYIPVAGTAKTLSTFPDFPPLLMETLHDMIPDIAGELEEYSPLTRLVILVGGVALFQVIYNMAPTPEPIPPSSAHSD